MPPADNALRRRVAAAVRRGWAAHRAGDRVEAARHYREAQAQAPDDPDALGGLGSLALEAGDAGLAIGLVGRALRAAPDRAQLHIVIGLALAAEGHNEAARAAFALACLHAPDDAQAHFGHARMLVTLDRGDEAMAAFGRALAIAPADAAIRNERGVALMARGRHAAALDDFRSARVSAPADILIAANVGGAQQALGRNADAETTLTALLERAGDDPDALSNRGLARLGLGRVGDALADLGRAYELAPVSIPIARNFAAGLYENDALDEAACLLDGLLARAPDDAASVLNRATIDLAQGRLAAGWPGYEARLRLVPARPHPGLPVWDGMPCAEGRLLVEAEQGIGDTLHFLRYAPLAADRARADIVLSLPASLHRIAARIPGVAAMIEPGGDPAGFDIAAHASLASLPRLFSPELTQIPPPFVPRATPDMHPARTGAPLGTRLRVGIAWAGNSAYKQDRRRSIAPALLAALTNIAGIDFISLQRGATVLPDGVRQPEIPLDDLADTARLIASLDLVVTVDTAIVHLAGGLGCPTWLLDRAGGDWRWLRGRIDSPWYPSVRIFRQETADLPDIAWPPVIARARIRLQAVAMLLREAGGQTDGITSSGEASTPSSASRSWVNLRSLLIFNPNTSFT